MSEPQHERLQLRADGCGGYGGGLDQCFLETRSTGHGVANHLRPGGDGFGSGRFLLPTGGASESGRAGKHAQGSAEPRHRPSGDEADHDTGDDSRRQPPHGTLGRYRLGDQPRRGGDDPYSPNCGDAQPQSETGECAKAGGQ